MNGPNRGPADVQFDTADFGAPQGTAVCVACKRSGLVEYYAVNGKVFCSTCKEALASKVSSDGAARRWGATLALGLGAAIVSGVAYGLTEMVSGYNLGIVSVAVGWLVGTAVSKGAGLSRRAVHRWLAVALTYLAVAASFLPQIVRHLPDGTARTFDVLMRIAVVCVEAPVRHSDPLSMAIYAFALYQAYRVTRPVQLSISGPLRVSAAPSRPVAPAPHG